MKTKSAGLIAKKGVKKGKKQTASSALDKVRSALKKTEHVHTPLSAKSRQNAAKPKKKKK